MRTLIALAHMIQIGSEDPRSALPQINMHNAQARRMARRMAYDQALCDLEEVAREGFPLDVEVYVVRFLAATLKKGA